MVKVRHGWMSCLKEIGMSCEKELLKLAEGLMDSTTGSRYFKDNNVINLQALIRDGGMCVYCKEPLWEEYSVAIQACGDHLLPKSGSRQIK
jgi:hypothetical protein